VWNLPVPNPDEPNSSLTYYLHLGPRNDARLRIVSSLLMQILTEPAFNVLRTKEQLGYIVSCSAWSLPGDSELGFRILVQSERNPLYLEERVEAFLESMKAKLEQMDETEFVEQKNGLEKKWREGLKNLAEETNRYWTHIENGFLDFYRRGWFSF
jgi:insulysin